MAIILIKKTLIIIKIGHIKLQYEESLNIGEISEKLQIAPSSAALHINILHKAEFG